MNAGTSTDPGFRVPDLGIEHPVSVLTSNCTSTATKRAFVVEETPSVSVLFASKGYTPEVYSPQSIAVHGDSVIGRI